MKAIIPTLVFILFFVSVRSQDVIVLLNGSRIKCNIVEIGPGQIKYIKVSNGDTILYSVDKAAILKIKLVGAHLDALYNQGLQWQSRQPENLQSRMPMGPEVFKRSGFSNITELSVQTQIPSGLFNYYHSTGIQTSFGYESNGLYLGVGAGLQQQFHQSFFYLPEGILSVYLEPRFTLNEGKVSPTIGANIGTNIVLQDYSFDNAATFTSEMDIGVRIFITRCTAILLSVGINYQRFNFEEQEAFNVNSLLFKAGFQF